MTIIWNKIPFIYGIQHIQCELTRISKMLVVGRFVLYCIVLYCIVLMGWSLLPNALRPFWDLLCSPNLDIRAWICRLILLRDLFFQAWSCLTSLKSQTRDPQLKVPTGGLVLRIFTSWINPSTSAVFEPVNLGSRGEHGTPRPPRPTSRQFSSLQLRVTMTFVPRSYLGAGTFHMWRTESGFLEF